MTVKEALYVRTVDIRVFFFFCFALLETSFCELNEGHSSCNDEEAQPSQKRTNAGLP